MCSTSISLQAKAISASRIVIEILTVVQSVAAYVYEITESVKHIRPQVAWMNWFRQIQFI